VDYRTCSITDCQRRHEARGWCATHYARWKRNGDPLYVDALYALRFGDDETRFLAKVDVRANGCWQWTANCQKRKGLPAYGSFKSGGANHFAHRWAYEHWVGPIPAGQHLDHYRFPQDGCIGAACVNPEHLRPTTARENALRSDAVSAWNAAKTHCSYGHPLAGDNLRIKRNNGQRCCQICSRRSWREWRARNPLRK
jgi:hypothetical protein